MGGGRFRKVSPRVRALLVKSHGSVGGFFSSSGGPGSNEAGFPLEVEPGLYASLAELQTGIARAAIEVGVNKSNPSSVITLDSTKTPTPHGDTLLPL